MNTKRAFIILFILVLAGSLAFLFFTLFEYRTKEIDVGYHGEARKNSYLAAQRFLEKNGSEVIYKTSFLRMSELPPPTDVLFIPTNRLPPVKVA